MSRIQKIAGIVFHGENDDYTLLIPDLSADENDEILRHLQHMSNAPQTQMI